MLVTSTRMLLALFEIKNVRSTTSPTTHGSFINKLEIMMIIEINNRKFYVSQNNPYNNEWSAVDENYDAEVIDGTWHSSCHVGIGNTPQKAIDDLLNLEDE